MNVNISQGTRHLAHQLNDTRERVVMRNTAHVVDDAPFSIRVAAILSLAARRGHTIRKGHTFRVGLALNKAKSNLEVVEEVFGS
jgi:hypothetical protein